MTLVNHINSVMRRVPAWTLYVIGPMPAFWYLYLGLTGGLGAEPIRTLEQALGLFALKLMIAVLAVTPLRKLTGVNLIKFRRALGLMVFFYIAFHLTVWLFLDVQVASQIWDDIIKRPYITIGMAGFVLMLPLALTSNNWSIRKMGPTVWRRLHWLTYPTAILGAVHFVMLAKTWNAEPLTYLGIVLVLLVTRMRFPKWRSLVANT